MKKTKIYLTIEDQYGIYGPGDKIRGTANLLTSDTSLVRSVKVICSGVCRVFTFNEQKKPVKSALQVLFTKSMVVHTTGKDSSSLTAGHHKWNYSCTLPASNQLPPSFDYRDQMGTAEIMYVVVMRIDGSDLSPNQSHCYLKFKYAPVRSLLIASEEAFAHFSEILAVRRTQDKNRRGWRRRIPHAIHKKVLGRDEGHRCFRITLMLPRCAVFSEYMDIAVKVESIPDNHHADTFTEFDLSLAEVEYQLFASTRIAFDKVSRFQRHLVQQESIHSVSMIPANEHWVSLQRRAPFRMQPRLYGMPFDKNSFSTIGPSFGTQNVVREYKLNVFLSIVAWQKTYRVAFEDNEIIVLPYELQATPD